MSHRHSSPVVLGLAVLLVGLHGHADLSTAQTGRQKSPESPSRTFVVDGSPVHNVGNLRVHASNWGSIGSRPNSGYPFSSAPSAEWPAGSRVEYLFTAGLWVGAIVNGLPSVSTSEYEFEFRPTPDPVDIVYRSAFGAANGHRIPSSLVDDDNDSTLDEDVLDGHDNDSDGQIDEDFAGISDQMFSRRFRDDIPGVTTIYPQHRPLHLAVHEESYQFSDADFDDFVGFTFSITNDGPDTMEDVYVGVFADGDVGHRDTPDYWEDDGTAFHNNLVVDHGAHGTQAYDFAYWYDVDGDAGQAPGYCGIVVLDHPVDPAGATAPPEVGVVTFAHFSGAASYENGGDPTNDFERYELMSSQIIEANSGGPLDRRTLISVGPFASIAPGETIEFSFALVVTPRTDFTHVARAAAAYHGLWFDLDGNSFTGVDGKEHQEHWYLPTDNPLPVAITHFGARAIDASAVKVAWELWADEAVGGFELFRAANGGELRPVTTGLIAADAREFVDDTVTPGARYEYMLVVHGELGATFASQRASVTVPGIALSLRQNAPNPFTGSTTIAISLPEAGAVEVTVFDVAGRHVATVALGVRAAGDHEFAWDGRNDAGEPVGAGVYFYRLKAGKETLTRKLLIVR